MSRLDELIAELCPDGVEYKPLSEIATITRGGSLQKKDFTEREVPCLMLPSPLNSRSRCGKGKVITDIETSVGRSCLPAGVFLCLWILMCHLMCQQKWHIKPFHSL